MPQQHQPLFKIAGALVAALALGIAIPASATVVTFNFDSMGYNSSSSPGSNSAVQTYLNGAWSAAGQSGNVLVSGAGMLSNNKYTGDGYVVGPSVCTRYYTSGACRTWTTTPATLGSTEGGVQGSATVHALSTTSPDDYVVNRGGSDDRITITFPYEVYAVSFDYEIFPNGTCPSSANCGTNGANLPDFDFLADGTLAFHRDSVYPGAGTYLHSPHSGHGSTEAAPQHLGVSGTWNFPGGVTALQFVDWPERIGIDNLVVDTACDQCANIQVPEPPVLPLAVLALGAAALAVRARRSGVRAK